MDDVGRLFRRLFGLPTRNDDFQNPDGWRGRTIRPRPNDQEPSPHVDDEEWSDGGIRGDIDKMFYHFHGNIWQHMESLHRQMEDMMKGFGAMDFPSDQEPPQGIEGIMPDESDPNNPHNDNGFDIWFGTPSPFFRFGSGSSKRKSPRDYMLKEEDEGHVKPALPAPHSPGLDPHSFQPFHRMPRGRWGKTEEKKDSDLDGKLSDQEVLDMITKKPEVPTERSPHHSMGPRVWSPGMSSWGKSVSITRRVGPDGKVEERRVVRDSAGREESSVTKSAGDQSHTVTTVTEQDGQTETRETFHNINEKEADKFDAQWNAPSRHPHSVDPNMPPYIDARDRDIFSKLFGIK